MDKSRDTLPFLELRNHKFVMTAAGSNELAVVIFIAKGLWGRTRVNSQLR